MRTIMYNTILSAGKIEEGYFSFDEKMSMVGENTGNTVFLESMKEQIIYDKECALDDFEVGNSNDNCIIPATNLINPHAKWIENFVPIFESKKGLITFAGLGAQANVGENPKDVVNSLTQKQIRFFKLLADSCVSFGVRGEFTANCLEEMGIRNYRIIGCPSLFQQVDGKFQVIPDASLDRYIFNVTPGKKSETKILKLGMSKKGCWIGQGRNELFDFKERGITISDTDVKKRFPETEFTGKVIEKYMNENAKIFFSYKRWKEFLENERFTFCFGSRFHGNMMALKSGIPALWITHDSRTQELVETLHLPHIKSAEIEKIDAIDNLLEYCNYKEFYKNYPLLFSEYCKFLNENGIKNKYNNFEFYGQQCKNNQAFFKLMQEKQYQFNLFMYLKEKKVSEIVLIGDINWGNRLQILFAVDMNIRCKRYTTYAQFVRGMGNVDNSDSAIVIVSDLLEKNFICEKNKENVKEVYTLYELLRNALKK